VKSRAKKIGMSRSRSRPLPQMRLVRGLLLRDASLFFIVGGLRKGARLHVRRGRNLFDGKSGDGDKRFLARYYGDKEIDDQFGSCALEPFYLKAGFLWD